MSLIALTVLTSLLSGDEITLISGVVKKNVSIVIPANIKNMSAVVRNFDNTLVVGESGEFIDQGGMIGFINKQGKIKLQINLKTINQSGLKVSAKLLEVADVVKGVKND